MKTLSTIQVFIPDGTNETYTSMMLKAIKQLESEVFYPSIKVMKPDYQEGHGLILTVTYDPNK